MLNLSNKKVLVVGAGISGFSAAKITKKLGAAVTLSDAKAEKDIQEDFAPLREAGIALVFGPQAASLLTGVDIVILSPAVPARIPLIKAARDAGIRVMSEVELAYLIAKAPMAAVTGTNGKTTTTTLLGLLLKAHYDAVGVGGNIGVPLSEVALAMPSTGYIAAEISSYQMEATEEFHPHIAAELNVTPDHIVRHGSMEVYQAMKERLFRAEQAGDFLILNYDDERTRDMKHRAKARIAFFSRRENLSEGACLADGMLVIRWGGKLYPLISEKELGIKGPHNTENALAASLMAFFAGVAPAEMQPVLKDFRGVEHRIEYVTTIDGVDYYNDSKATNTDSAMKALDTFPAGIVLLAGGDDKMTDLTDFMQLAKVRVHQLILVGAAAKRFHEAARENGMPEEHIHDVGYSMERAVALAHELAKAPETVLLSPACASFDMYNGMAERGRHFKSLVHALEA